MADSMIGQFLSSFMHHTATIILHKTFYLNLLKSTLLMCLNLFYKFHHLLHAVVY